MTGVNTHQAAVVLGARWAPHEVQLFISTPTTYEAYPSVLRTREDVAQCYDALLTCGYTHASVLSLARVLDGALFYVTLGVTGRLLVPLEYNENTPLAAAAQQADFNLSLASYKPTEECAA